MSQATSKYRLLYGNPSSAYLGELLLGTLHAASAVDARLIVERTTPDLDPASLEDRLVRDWDALIVPPPMSDIAGIRSLVKQLTFPAAFISSATDPGRANEIRIDDDLAAYEMTNFLIRRSHTRIGFIKGHPNQTVSQRCFEGHLRALGDAALEQREDMVAQGLFTYRSGEEPGLQLLSAQKRPTAIFASNDDMAAGVLSAAGRLGLSVPADLSVVGFDNSPIALTIWPKLTTLAQPVAKMAAEAVYTVIRAHKDKSEPFETILMAHELIERDSVRTISKML